MDRWVAGRCTHSTLACHWWWDNMYVDTTKYVGNCQSVPLQQGQADTTNHPLHYIPASRPFQIVGADLMQLLKMLRDNKYLLVLQDYLALNLYSPWSKDSNYRTHLSWRSYSTFWSTLLTDRETNLLLHQMKDLCDLLGITKLNTNAYQLECDGMVKRFNRTLKVTLRKHAARFGNQ